MVARLKNTKDDDLIDVVFDYIRHDRYVGITYSRLSEIFGIGYADITTEEELQGSLQTLLENGQIIQVGSRYLLHPTVFKTATGSAQKPVFEENDIWALKGIAVQGSRKPCSLRDIMFIVDYINRSSLTFDEFFGALNRLHAGKLINKRKQKYLLAPRGKKLFEKVRKCCGRSIWDQMKGLRNLLLCPCCGVQLKKVSWRIMITEEDVAQAYKDYSALFNSV